MSKFPVTHKTSGLLAILLGAAAVYGIAHWATLANPYVIADDVRQQIYWMQQWQDPELFQDDLLARYARNYVPWGVQAIYYAASPFMNPVQFSKVLEGLLWVVTAGFLFGIGRRFKDSLTAATIVCTSFFFSIILAKISGGMSQSFAFPLLAAYLFFLGRGQVTAGAAVIALQSLLNPYIFLLCLVTHLLYLIARYGRELARAHCGRWSQVPVVAKSAVASNWPLAIGIPVMALKYARSAPAEFGALVTRADMFGKPEYTALGRYEILPGPSLAYDIVWPWRFFFPFEEVGPAAGWIGLMVTVGVIILALVGIWRKTGRISLANKDIDLSGFAVFGYLLPASVILYLASDLLLMRLFLPTRYVEFSLTLFYATAFGAFVSMLVRALEARKRALYAGFCLCAVLAGVRLMHVGIFDYSRDAPLCRFLQTTPKRCLIAGHPKVMDNVVTFAGRRAFVTYELSHTWYTRYWETVRQRTTDFFRAYYSSNPDGIRDFCRTNHIDYLVVREADFKRDPPRKKRIYFEPFNQYIQTLISARDPFALLDPREFPPVYQADGVRVVRMN